MRNPTGGRRIYIGHRKQEGLGVDISRNNGETVDALLNFKKEK